MRFRVSMTGVHGIQIYNNNEVRTLQYAGKGITQKALSVCINYLFAEYGFAKLFLRTHENDILARSIAEKIRLPNRRKNQKRL